MFTRQFRIAAVMVLAAGAQAQQSRSVKTFPQTKPFVPVKPQPIYKVPVYSPPIFYPPVFYKPFPVYKSPYTPKFPWYGW